MPGIQSRLPDMQRGKKTQFIRRLINGNQPRSDPAIRINRRGYIKTLVPIKSCTSIFLATLFIIAKTESSPDVHQQEYRSTDNLVIKKNGSLRDATILMNLKTILLSEKSQT